MAYRPEDQHVDSRHYPSGSPLARAYDVVADSKNNMYGMHMNNDKLWITDGKTLETVWFDFPTKGAGCRRGHIDSQDRLWCGVFNGNGLAMFDPKTRKITEWRAPTPWTRPYDAQFDDKTYVLDGWNGQRFCGPAEYPDRGIHRVSPAA